MFIAALCIITEACRQPKCYSVGEWLSCLMGYYTDAEEQVIAITTEESEKQWVSAKKQTSRNTGHFCKAKNTSNTKLYIPKEYIYTWPIYINK